MPQREFLAPSLKCVGTAKCEKNVGAWKMAQGNVKRVYCCGVKFLTSDGPQPPVIPEPLPLVSGGHQQPRDGVPTKIPLVCVIKTNNKSFKTVTHTGWAARAREGRY